MVVFWEAKNLHLFATCPLCLRGLFSDIHYLVFLHSVSKLLRRKIRIEIIFHLGGGITCCQINLEHLWSRNITSFVWIFLIIKMNPHLPTRFMLVRFTFGRTIKEDSPCWHKIVHYDNTDVFRENISGLIAKANRSEWESVAIVPFVTVWLQFAVDLFWFTQGCGHLKSYQRLDYFSLQYA